MKTQVRSAGKKSAVLDPMIPEVYTVGRTHRETKDTFTMELHPPAGVAPVAFAPGQFNMLYVYGVGECAISISGDPSASDRILHTTRVVGSVTKALHKLKAGAPLGVRGPFGTAWPMREAEGCDVVFIAGGIGLAPLRPALYRIMKERHKYGKVVLLYGARTPDDVLFHRDVRAWGGRMDVDVHVSVDRGDKDWHGNVGVVTSLVRRAPFDRTQTVAMVCGPEIMMRFAVMELEKRGLSDERIYVSMERNMKCAIGLCGHCQFGPEFICKDGPVFPYDRVRRWFDLRDI